MNRKNGILLIGIVAFGLASINSFLFTTKKILKDINIVLKLDENLNFWLSQIIVLTSFIIVTFFLINKFGKNFDKLKDDLRKYFLITIVIFCVSQVAEFLYGFFVIDFMIQNYLDSYSSYNDYMKTKPFLEIHNSILFYVRYILLVVLIFYQGFISNTKSTRHQS